MIKHISKDGDQPFFIGLFSAVNEIGEIRTQAFVQSTTNRMLEGPIKKWRETAEALNTTVPVVVFTDRCCDDADFYLQHFPSLRQDLVAKPLLEVAIEKVILYQDANLMIAAIMEELEAANDNVVGFDCEWKVSREPTTPATYGPGYKVALIQIAVPGGMIFVLLE